MKRANVAGLRRTAELVLKNASRQDPVVPCALGLHGSVFTGAAAVHRSCSRARGSGSPMRTNNLALIEHQKPEHPQHRPHLLYRRQEAVEQVEALDDGVRQRERQTRDTGHQHSEASFGEQPVEDGDDGRHEVRERDPGHEVVHRRDHDGGMHQGANATDLDQPPMRRRRTTPREGVKHEPQARAARHEARHHEQSHSIRRPVAGARLEEAGDGLIEPLIAARIPPRGNREERGTGEDACGRNQRRMLCSWTGLPSKTRRNSRHRCLELPFRDSDPWNGESLVRSLWRAEA